MPSLPAVLDHEVHEEVDKAACELLCKLLRPAGLPSEPLRGERASRGGEYR